MTTTRVDKGELTFALLRAAVAILAALAAAGFIPTGPDFNAALIAIYAALGGAKSGLESRNGHH